MSFANVLKDLIQENGISIKNLSASTGIKLSTIYFYFERDTLPDVEHAIKLCKYFDCSINYLIGRDDDIKLRWTNDKINFIDSYNFLLAKNETSNYSVCNKLGLNRNSIYNWRTGQTPKMITLIQLADFFDTSVDFLLGLVNNE